MQNKLFRAAVMTAAALFLAHVPLLNVACAQDNNPAAAAAAAAPAKLKLSTERLVIFKDGYGLIIKNAAATADESGRVHTTDVPDAAILGSFWAIGDGNKLVGMRAEWDEKQELRKKPTPCITVVELLRANVGKKVTLALTEKRTVSGTVAEILDLPPQAPPTAAAGAPGFTIESDPATAPFELLRRLQEIHRVQPWEAGMAPAGLGDPDSATLKRELTPRGGDFVVIEDAEIGRMVLPITQVQSVSGKDLITKMTREEEAFTRSKRLSFDFGKESAGKAVSLKLFYFTAGLRWIPTYRISGDLKEKADIALQGEILNDIEDVDKAALDLVVGVPNFRYKESVSPLTLERQLRGALAAAADYGRNDFRGQMMNSNFIQQPGNFAGRAAGPAVAPNLAPELSGSGGEQDLFLYSLKEFSLKKGARASAPLWQNSVPLRHIYTMDVKAIRNRGGGDAGDVAAPSASPLRITRNSVWHQLELANNSTVPWTTGAALAMRQNVPLSQDLLTYTPVGGVALLPLTVAVDIRGVYEETEVARKPNSLVYDNYNFTWVQKKGTITLTNYRKEKATMRISAATGGKAETASDDGKIKINDFVATDWHEGAYHQVNNHSDVVWELTLDPGQAKTVTYTVGFYIR